MATSKAGVDPKWIRNKSDEIAVSEGCYFDKKAAEHICNFFSNFLSLTTGRLAGDKFVLLDWQKDYLMRLNGWKNKDGTRRFNRSFVGISKKNGKSQCSSGLALYYGLADNEPQPEIVVCANSRDQANIIFRESKNMINKSSAIKKICNVVDSRKRIELPDASGYIAVISSEASTAEGINASVVLLDETHTFYGRELYDALRYAGIARKQSLLIETTTAGVDKESFCYENWQHAKKVIAGDVIDTTLLPIIYSAEGMDLDTEDAWIAANPSLGTVLSMDEFRKSYEKAKQSPIEWQSFCRYRLGLWQDSDLAWLDMHHWEACPNQIDKEELLGQICFGGLDLSHKKDLTSLVLYFPHQKAFLCWAWTTKEQVHSRQQKNKASYLRFIEAGELIVLDGGVIDQGFMEAKILELSKIYQIHSIAFDAWSCQQLALNMEAEGMDMAPFRQGYGSLSEPSKQFEAMIIKEEITHFNNGLLRWCASNCMVTQDPSGNIKPDKDKSHEMIDPIVCCIMASGLAGITKIKPNRSIYEDRELLVF